MNDQEQQSLFSRPLVRVAICCSVCAALVIGGIGAANYVRNHGRSAETQFSETELAKIVDNAENLCRQEDYATAVAVLRPVRQALFQREHVAGLRTYAEAQEMVPLANNAHIALAASTLVRIASLDPNDLPVRLRLFELFRQLDDNKEACRYGNEAVALAQHDEELCLRVARTHLHAGAPEIAQKTAERILEAHPQHMGAASLKVECLVAEDVDSAGIVTFIDEICPQQNASARMDRALLALVLANATNDQESAKLLTSMLTSNDEGESLDGDRRKIMVSAFESAGRTQDVLRVVECGSNDADHDPGDAN